MNKLRFIAALALCLSGAGAVSAQELSLSTNVLGYVNLGTLNMEASYGMNRHWSLNAGVKYNPFTFDTEKKGNIRNKQQAYAVGARYWPWHIYSGWWISGKMQFQEYNMGGIVSPVTSEGNRYGGGIGGGYTYMLNPHLNLEMGLGLWSGYEAFTKYECPVCGSVIEKGDKLFVQPSDLILSFSYVF